MSPWTPDRPKDSTTDEWQVRASRDRCIGSGMCALTAPGVFDQDPEEGLVEILRPRLPRTDPDADAAREAVGICPAEAIGLR
ncbi:ferredoxin [Streptomyces spiroverticillatus]|uniref:Ferredoxin n=1 Tax=Streptomyces finlayi TaxID=67296 RepID=A0A919C9C3_9ACTN|nr:ferredoxin [Streptomyces finlayi]GHA07538.1 ferredoxin [Streptomyces spiroverticillatus]GHC90863.1 ferredoxin [Streptomyces finlayi]